MVFQCLLEAQPNLFREESDLSLVGGIIFVTAVNDNALASLDAHVWTLDHWLSAGRPAVAADVEIRGTGVESDDFHVQFIAFAPS